jgi:hypothetical protein
MTFECLRLMMKAVDEVKGTVGNGFQFSEFSIEFSPTKRILKAV